MIAVSTTPSTRPGRARKPKVRICVGCRQEDEQTALVRLVLGPDNDVMVDLAAGGFGRGAWVHPEMSCVSKAAPRGLARSFREPIKTTAAELTSALQFAAERRTRGLLGSARRARQVSVGSEAVRRSVADGEAKLLVVAKDARAAAETPWVLDCVKKGNAVAWGTKSVLGEVFSRDDVGVIAILDNGLADALRRAVRMSHVAAPQSAKVGE